MTILLQGAGLQQVATGGGGDPIGDALRAAIASGYWTMNESSGTRADSKGDNDLTPTNAPASAVGKIGNAINISGTGFLKNNNTLTEGLTAFSVAFWINAPAIIGSLSDILVHSEADDIYCELYTDTVLMIGARVGGTENNEYIQDIEITPNAWHFVCFWWSTGTHISLAVDGVVHEATGTAVNTLLTPAGYFAIGESYDDIPCLLDEFAIFNRVITSDERAYLYNSGTGRSLYP